MDSENPPNLSQYFANDPPSFFDELNPVNTQGATPEKASSAPDAPVSIESASPAEKQPAEAAPAVTNTSLFCSNFSGGFQIQDYLESPLELEEDLRVPEEVRQFWPRPKIVLDEPIYLTVPGLHVQEELPDLIAQAVTKHLGEAELAHRRILTIDQVTQDERGLRALISAGCYRAAVNLTGRLLTICGQGYGRAGQPTKHTPHSLQLWFTRLALLVKLGEYELLQAEAETFELLNQHDLYYEFYPEMYPDKRGSMASFSFRLLLAEVPLYLGNPQLALDRLSQLFVCCNEIKAALYELDFEAGEYWYKREKRVLHSIVNCAIIMKKYNLIDDIMRDMILADDDLSKEERRSLFSAWGRIYLQIGDIFGAEQKFAEARRLREMNSTPDIRDLVDKGLITVAQNDFQQAYDIFQRALKLESGNIMILNNMGACLLYAGKLKDAIHVFESAINANPQKSLNESLLVNLSTLYELESNNSKNKKLNLLRLINRYKPDLNIGLEICLKLQSV